MKDYLSEAKEITNKDKRELLMQTSTSSMNGAITGLVIGLMVGYYKKYNVYASGLVGGILGGVATALIVNKK